MSFLELAKRRYSTREYLAKPVEPEKIKEILEAGRVAPTACNNQPQRILVVQTTEGMAKITKSYKDFHAPAALIVCADHKDSWNRSYDGKDSADIDASIVTTQMMLCATELGLDSVWICAFNPSIIREEFHIPEHIEPINILLLGYGKGDPKSPVRHDAQRKALDKIVVYESF